MHFLSLPPTLPPSEHTHISVTNTKPAYTHKSPLPPKTHKQQSIPSLDMSSAISYARMQANDLFCLPLPSPSSVDGNFSCCSTASLFLWLAGNRLALRRKSFYHTHAVTEKLFSPTSTCKGNPPNLMQVISDQYCDGLSTDQKIVNESVKSCSLCGLAPTQKD